MVSGVVLLVEDVTAQARLEADVRERATQLQALAESARVVSSALQREEEVIALTLEQIKRVIPYDTATLWLRGGRIFACGRRAGVRQRRDAVRLGGAGRRQLTI